MTAIKVLLRFFNAAGATLAICVFELAVAYNRLYRRLEERVNSQKELSRNHTVQVLSITCAALGPRTQVTNDVFD